MLKIKICNILIIIILIIYLTIDLDFFCHLPILKNIKNYAQDIISIMSLK